MLVRPLRHSLGGFVIVVGVGEKAEASKDLWRLPITLLSKIPDTRTKDTALILETRSDFTT